MLQMQVIFPFHTPVPSCLCAAPTTIALQYKIFKIIAKVQILIRSIVHALRLTTLMASMASARAPTLNASACLISGEIQVISWLQVISRPLSLQLVCIPPFQPETLLTNYQQIVMEESVLLRQLRQVRRDFEVIDHADFCMYLVVRPFGLTSFNCML